MTVDKWNEIRERELSIFLKKRLHKLDNFSYYPRKTNFRCSDCQKPVHDEAHIDDSGKFPKRQVICTECQKVDYRYLTDIEMVVLDGKK